MVDECWSATRRPVPTTGRGMLQDLERGRPMEIETQLAIVQDIARQSGVATPTLDTLLPLVALRAQMAGCLPAGMAIGETKI